jgi:hypothetical protein
LKEDLLKKRSTIVVGTVDPVEFMPSSEDSGHAVLWMAGGGMLDV